MKVLLITLIFLLVGCSPNLIGKNVPQYPKGVESKYGSCIAYPLGWERACDVAVAELRYEDGVPYAVIVQKEVGRNGDKAVWLVTDQVEWPKQPDKTYVSFGPCLQNSESGKAIIALVAVTEEQWFKAIQWAKEIDLTTGKFVSIPPSSVKCENEGWGV